MSRFAAAVLLVGLGLAAGLWLGFNPKARATVEKDFAQAKESLVSIQSGTGIKLGGGAASGETTKAPESSRQSGGSASTQVSAALKEFWSATRQLWFNLLARLDISP